MNNYLFAIDEKTEEIIVSESPKGSNKVKLIERISSNDNKMLFHAVQTLTCISKETDIDLSLFKTMDKICQSVYLKYNKF